MSVFVVAPRPTHSMLIHLRVMIQLRHLLSRLGTLAIDVIE